MRESKNARDEAGARETDYRRGFSLQEFTFFMRRPKRGDLVLLLLTLGTSCLIISKHVVT